MRPGVPGAVRTPAGSLEGQGKRYRGSPERLLDMAGSGIGGDFGRVEHGSQVEVRFRGIWGLRPTPFVARVPILIGSGQCLPEEPPGGLWRSRIRVAAQLGSARPSWQTALLPKLVRGLDVIGVEVELATLAIVLVSVDSTLHRGFSRSNPADNRRQIVTITDRHVCASGSELCPAGALNGRAASLGRLDAARVLARRAD